VYDADATAIDPDTTVYGAESAEFDAVPVEFTRELAAMLVWGSVWRTFGNGGVSRRKKASLKARPFSFFI
jgi:hypothetical protein